MSGARVRMTRVGLRCWRVEMMGGGHPVAQYLRYGLTADHAHRRAERLAREIVAECAQRAAWRSEAEAFDAGVSR